MTPVRDYGYYIEWEADAERRGNGPRRDDHPRVEDVFDAEARRRFGEFIARAMTGEAGPPVTKKFRKKDFSP